MSIFSDFFKKEAPLLGLQGSGGGLGFLAGGSGGGEPGTFTGGTVTQININGQNYNLHTFAGPSPATFTASGSNSPNGGAGGTDGAIEIFLVGGGGGGAVLGGGGGGGGVAVYAMPTGIQPGSYTVRVGDGGSPESGWEDINSNGQPSYFQYGSPTQKIEVAGGGAGQSYSYSYPDNTSHNVNVANTGGENYPGNGNNKGHWTYQSATNTVAAPVGDFIRQSEHSGYAGGNGSTNCCPCRGGGGAGAGQAGVNARTPPANQSGGANGGNGIQVNFDGNNYYWGGGGAADGYCMNTSAPMPSDYQGKGGAGGGGGAATPGLPGYGLGGGFSINSGGNGYTNPGDGPGAPGGANSGGGGGAGSNGSGSTPYTGGAGGSGIVMIRYKV